MKNQESDEDTLQNDHGHPPAQNQQKNDPLLPLPTPPHSAVIRQLQPTTKDLLTLEETLQVLQREVESIKRQLSSPAIETTSSLLGTARVEMNTLLIPWDICVFNNCLFFLSFSNCLHPKTNPLQKSHLQPLHHLLSSRFQRLS